MTVEDLLSELPETEYSNTGEPVYPNPGDKAKMKMEVKCKRSDIQRTYTVESVEYDYNNECIFLEILPE